MKIEFNFDAPMHLKMQKQSTKILIIGVFHTLKHNQFPEEYYEWLAETEIFLQEGENGFIGVDPLNHVESFINNKNDWWTRITQQQQEKIQFIIDDYCINFSYDKVLASNLSFPAIFAITSNIVYWYNGIHPKLYQLFKDKNINLDFDEVPNNTFECNHEYMLSKLNSYDNCINSQSSENLQVFSPQNSAQNLHLIKDYIDQYVKEEGEEFYQEYCLSREASWIKIIMSQAILYNNIAICCGSAHIYGISKLLGECGFELLEE